MKHNHSRDLRDCQILDEADGGYRARTDLPVAVRYRAASAKESLMGSFLPYSAAGRQERA